MRAFIAIDLPEALRTALGCRQADLRSALALCSSPSSGHVRVRPTGGVRWVRPEGIHLTLKFLGEVSAAELDRVIAALTPLGAFSPFRAEVRGFGFFPNTLRPQVFWARINAPPALAALATQVDAMVAKLGFPRERRTFSPHLTMARIRTAAPQPALTTIANESGAGAIGEFEVRRFVLFESKLQAGKPPEYRKIAGFPAS
ncbi:MAG: RNA 2',3'-cyclic phosphodiesterase [Terriglobia bacterium]